ncbi:MAG: hypothetical protein NC548_35415 [Lachnospiraceae bacterium]|nr:hypothetical protein [Lachnospiraceae bacterium]
MERLAIQKGVPYLECIAGPMFSSKSTEINRRLINIDYYNKHRAEFYGCSGTISYIVLRPDTDTRDAVIRPVPYDGRNQRIVHRNDIHTDVQDNPTNLLEQYDYIILDEAQFFAPEVIDQVKDLLDHDKYVIVAGLDKDYRGEPFSDFMKWAMCVADDVTKLTAICVKCGQPSTMAKLITTDPNEKLDGNVVIEDENHKYVPMCRKCMALEE